MKLSRLNFQSLKTNLVSKIFQPLTVAPKDAKGSPVNESLNMSKSQKLMLEMGIIRQSQNGLFHVLPLGLRAMNKLKNLVDSHMQKLGAQEISIPLIVDSALWKKSGRWDKAGDEVFKLKDRHDKELILNPTHEESAAELMATIPQLSHHHLPLLLYQTSTKFRDEMRPRCGLIRGREFIMKDLYSFDESLDRARRTYDEVSATYYNIFSELQLEAIRVEADTGEIGGLHSHEYHISCDIGEDTLRICSNCSHATISPADSCEVCKMTEFRKMTALEVGHTFLLGDRYTSPLRAVYTDKNQEVKPLIMSSYGLGLSRILAACVESLSTDSNINWPYAIAPYKIVIIPAKEGSNEYSAATKIMAELYETLNQIPHLKEDIVIDDRNKLTIGKRVVHSQKTGYPYILVVGRKCLQDSPSASKEWAHWFATFDNYLEESEPAIPEAKKKKDPPEIEIIEQAPNAAPFTHSLPFPELVDYFTRRVQGSNGDDAIIANA